MSKFVSTVVAGVAVVTVGGLLAGAVGPGGKSTATVVRVADGDTLEVTYQGVQERVRLLNVDTPEVGAESECLGPEATQFLESRLPAGTEVRLELDQEHRDGYGRLLAGVYVGDDLVNAEVAERGLGVAVLYKPNAKFYDEVAAAQDEAVEAGVGFYDPAIGCAPPAQAAQVVQQFMAVPAQDPSSLAEAVAALALADKLIGDAERAAGRFERAAAFSYHRAKDALGVLTSDISRARREARDRRDRLARQVEIKEAAAERLAEQARQVEAKRVAEEKAKAEAEAKRVVDLQRQRQAERQRSTSSSTSTKSTATKKKASTTKTTTPKKKVTKKKATNPYPGYNGPRCYAPGGKTWKPCPKR